jgi:hypothetical protein
MVGCFPGTPVQALQLARVPDGGSGIWVDTQLCLFIKLHKLVNGSLAMDQLSNTLLQLWERNGSVLAGGMTLDRLRRLLGKVRMFSLGI